MSGRYLKTKITTRAVESLKPGEALSDITLPGYHVRCQKGARVYFVRKYAFGQRHYFNIGEHAKAGLTERKARDKAEGIIYEIKQGNNPTAERQKMRDMPTLNTFANFFFETYASKLKQSTLADYKSSYNTHVRNSKLGKLKLDRITHQNLTALHFKLKEKRRSANKILQILSSMYNEAQRAGYVEFGFNPTKNIKHYKIEARQRFLSEAELEQIGGVLSQAEEDGSESLYAIAAIRLLIFTGARRNEILTLRWEWVDFERGVLNLPDSKTGSKIIHLSPPALELLSTLPRVRGNPFVIVGLRPGTHLVNLRKTWVRVREKAGITPITLPDETLQHARLHDLRHSFASIAVNGGASLPMIGALLGHSQVSTTARYAHLADDPLKKVNDDAGNIAARALGANVCKST